MGVLGLVCRLYSERDDNKEDKTGEEGGGGKEESRVRKEVDDQQARTRSIKIERAEVSSAESEAVPQHDSSESEEDEFLMEDGNEYYWD